MVMFRLMHFIDLPGTLYLIPSNVWHAVEAVISVAYVEVYSGITVVKFHCNHGNANLDHIYELETITQMITSPVSIPKVIYPGTSKAGRV